MRDDVMNDEINEFVEHVFFQWAKTTFQYAWWTFAIIIINILLWRWKSLADQIFFK